MARSLSDEELQLRRRARRRLIGAVVLTTAVVVLLPMVLDSEPRPIGEDIAVQIPSPGAGPYAPRPAPATRGAGSTESPAIAPSETAKPGAARAGAPGAAPAPATGAEAPASSPARPARAQSALESPGAPPSAPAGSPSGPSPAPPKAPAVARGAPAAAPGDAALLAGTQPAGATASRADEPPARPRADPAQAAADPSATGSADKAEKADKADKAKPRPETFVIQLGAFSEASRAKDRHALLQKAGVRSYTEVIKTPTGDKTRVRAGPFPTREAADQVNEKLKALGIADGVVVTRRY